MICSQCCGEKRKKFIPCPENCPVLKEHYDYSKERQSDKFAWEWAENFGKMEEKELTVLFAIQFILFDYLYNHSSSFDYEILTGLEYVRRQISPIKIPGEIKNQLGQELLKILLEGIEEGQIKENQIPNVLDKLIKFAKKYKGDTLYSNKFVKGFTAFMEKYHPEMVEKIKNRKSSSIL